ncbi:MAG: D-threo-aldose 1-dehydrogenase, partial [Actinomycetota bacterium]|nr:D-threo-aldose 1-dehydrogenase [Actinomycetota bacterium]
HRVFDFSRDGIRRSLDASLARLGVDSVDIVYLHDPDDHWAQAVDEAWPALAELRDDGVIRSIGAGMNQSAMLARFVRETEMDVVLLAGRYTLLDQGALADLLPVCVERSTSVVIGGVFNSGILVNPNPDSMFDYRPVTSEVLERARRLAQVCERHGVPLAAAALQFPLAHPAVATVLVGARNAKEVEQNACLLALPIPRALWDELRGAGLLPENAPTPPTSMNGMP